MGFWNRQSEDRTLTQPTLLQPILTYVPADSTVTPINALSSPNVYACTRVLADAAASCPLHVYRRAADDGRRRAGGQTAELLKRPAENVTQAEFISTAMAHLLLWGNCFIGKYRDADGRVEALLPISPDRVQVERRAGRVRFTVTTDGHQSEHGVDDIVHAKALSTDGLAGLSPIRQMRLALELDNAVRDASTALFQNHAAPAGILSSTHRMTAEQAEALSSQWHTRHSGGGRIAIMDGTLAFTQISMPADDAQFVEARKLSAVDVARCFRVPPWMVAADAGSPMTYSNVESQALSFVQFSLRPWLVVIEQALTSDRDLFGPSSYCEFLIDSLLRADSATRAAVYTAGLDPVTGWLRRDEVRRLENLPPESPADLAELVSTATNGQGVIAT